MGWFCFPNLLDPDTNLETLTPQGPSVWELPSPQGTQTKGRSQKAGQGVSPGLGPTNLEMKRGKAKTKTLSRSLCCNVM